MRALTASASDPDIVDESLDLFRANSLFRNFEIKGGADRVLIYLILFISDCLGRIANGQTKGWSQNEAGKQLASYAVDNFSLPGEPGFPLNSLYAAPTSRPDAGGWSRLNQYRTYAEAAFGLHRSSEAVPASGATGVRRSPRRASLRRRQAQQVVDVLPKVRSPRSSLLSEAVS